ncbi:macrophage-expressed gene 1 protein-like [Saccostrea echinata]|uniref:macrophage-expressed gene 1 protein-like n=1 Tax=Saccostrea echinata TaxID=191078 RepID=UPI002A8307DD|nr:macrophage-expressed gene 1 protein-like [Saccostrea echinata]
MLALCVVAILFHSTESLQNYSVGDPQACNIGNGNENFMFEVLPGFGWDNLVNENRGVVVNFNYSKCKTTEDRKYLIPDGVVTIPIKKSQLNIFSKVYDHWSQYESDTAFSINVGGSASIAGIKIAASLSTEYEHIKKHQLEDKSFTTKVQARFVRYTAIVLPDLQLDRSFRKRLLKIANHIQHNRKLSTKYESELLVRDFGTHVLTSVDAGASIVKVDQVDSSLRSDTEIDKVQIGFAASVSFFGIASINTKTQYSHSKTTIEKYMKSIKNSDIRAYGGPPLSPENFTLSKWTTAIGNDLVAVDRNGFPLDYVISTASLPELSESLVEEIVQSVRSAISSYFLHNTYPGCTNPDAPNFSKISNLDDGTCHAPLTNLSFGGVFQECIFKGALINNENLCDKITTKNSQTQDFKCPVEFEKVVLFKGKTDKAQHEHKCHKCWLFFTCCHDQSYYGLATYTSYWCRAKPNTPVQENSGFLFGGLYSDRTSNFVTQSKSCPQYYNPMTIASNIRVCISDDYELGAKSAVPFGGFYSCQHGNPLVDGKYTKSCPKGFSNHLATVDNNCEIQYCVRTSQLSELKFPTVQLPPFIGIPAESLAEPANYIISHDSESWIQLINPETKAKKPDESTWTTLNSAPTEMAVLMKKFSSNHVVSENEDSGMSKGAIAGLSVGLTTAICLLLGILIVIRRNRRQRKIYESFD